MIAGSRCQAEEPTFENVGALQRCDNAMSKRLSTNRRIQFVVQPQGAMHKMLIIFNKHKHIPAHNSRHRSNLVDGLDEDHCCTTKTDMIASAHIHRSPLVFGQDFVAP